LLIFGDGIFAPWPSQIGATLLLGSLRAFSPARAHTHQAGAFCLAEFPNANERGHRRCLDQRGMDAMNAGLNNFIASIRRRAGVSIKKNDK
jgi:hypothetical protein